MLNLIMTLIMLFTSFGKQVKLASYDKWFIDEAVKYIMKINKKNKKDIAFDIAYYTVAYSKLFGIDAEISLCVMKAESSFNIQADSGIAGGLLQVNYRFWSVDKEKLVRDIQYSIYFGVKVLRYTFELGDKLSIVPENVPLYRYFLLYHGGVKRFFARKFTLKEKRYIRNIRNCLDYFERKYFDEVF